MSIKTELFKRFFNFQMASAMLKAIYDTDNKNKNRDLVNVIKSRLSNLQDEIKEMSEDEIETEKPYKVAYIVKKFLHFKRQNQKGQGLKMLTPDQMISRLLISLAKLKAGSNSEKLKNGMRQIYIYRSKKLPKTIYNNLINTVKKWKQSL